MFRHTTKQTARSQEKLKSNASIALEKDRQLLCRSVYHNTYHCNLPPASIDMLNNVVMSLTACGSEVDGTSRKVHTLAKFVSPGVSATRVCFLQPEVSSATAVSRSALASVINKARDRAVGTFNNPSPGRVTVSKEKCQVIGRLAPYIIHMSGLTREVTWTYFNASKSRIFYVLSSPDTIEMMSLTKETIHIYQGFCGPDCAIVYVSNMRCFKVTASPDDQDNDDSPNKSTCVFLYCDGTYKVLGTPHKSYRVCSMLRDTMVKAHTSPMCSRIERSLVKLEEAGSKASG